MGEYFDRAIAVVDRSPPQTKASVFWRKREPDFDQDGHLVRGGMFGHQRAFWRLPNFIKALVGGFGSGKTILLCKRAMASALQNAPVPVGLVSPTYQLARQTTLKTLGELAQGKQTHHGPRHFWWDYNANSKEFRIRHRGRNATVLILSGNNPLSLRGPNLAAAYIDEPFIQEEEVFKQMVARVRHPEATAMEIALAGTPEQLNWGYDLLEGEVSERHDVGYITASTRENLALAGAYVERLEGSYTDKAASAYIEGQFVNLAEGLVYYGFDPFENVVDLPMPHGAQLGAGMDFNVNPMASAVFWHQGDHIHFFDEIELPNSDTQEMCDVLKEEYWERGLRDVYPDASGKSRHSNAPGGETDYTYIERAGFTINVHSDNPHPKDRFNSVNGKLKPRRGRISMTIGPKCKKLIGYLQKYAHELKNLDRQKAMSHLLDAKSYAVAYLFPVDSDRFGIKMLRGA